MRAPQIGNYPRSPWDFPGTPARRTRIYGQSRAVSSPPWPSRELAPAGQRCPGGPLPRQKGERERGEHEDEQRNRARLAIGVGPRAALAQIRLRARSSGAARRRADQYRSHAAGPGRDGRPTTGHGAPPLPPATRDCVTVDSHAVAPPQDRRGPRIRRTRELASTMSTAVSVSSTKPWNICKFADPRAALGGNPL